MSGSAAALSAEPGSAQSTLWKCATDGCAWWCAVVVVLVVVLVLVLMVGHAMGVECEGRTRTGGEGSSSRREEARLLRSGTRDEGYSPALAIKRRPRHWIIPAGAPRVLCGAEQDGMSAKGSAPPGSLISIMPSPPMARVV